MYRVLEFLDLPLNYHLVAGFFIRIVLIIYGKFHDRTYDVPYTDVDYKVFTDASRHILDGNSPYKRHTYRYSPLVAILMIPNVLLTKEFGKDLFSIFDILVGCLVKKLVEYQLKKRRNATKIATYCSLFWLYNPLSIGISTRGNADSIPCFLIISSLFFLQNELKLNQYLKLSLSGVMLGFAIHLRLYPLVFTFPMYLSLGSNKISRHTRLKDGILALLPNKPQITLTLSCMFTTFILTISMYLLYGYEFLFETYIYHLFRKDTRHNFSVLFYYSYLTMDQLAFDVVKTITQIFEFIILFVLSLSFGRDPKSLPFALFCQAVVLVTFNSVVTSQYFVWFLSLLPLVVHNLKLIPARALVLTILWVSAQGAWLFYAYLLEFNCREVFILIWLQGVVFFCANIYILGQLIKSYSYNHGFGLDTREIRTD